MKAAHPEVIRVLFALLLASAAAFGVVAGPAWAQQAQAIVEWPESQGGNGHFYSLTSGRSNWLDSQAEAETRGGYLVAINDAAEQQFIVQTFLSGASSTETYWIGLTDQDTEGTFEWVNGEQVTYTNWYPGEPNDFNVGEDYVIINWHFTQGQTASPGDWNDVPLEANQVGIVELPAPILVPGPAGLGLVFLMFLLAALATVNTRETRGRKVV